jgi:DNA processing protein
MPPERVLGPLALLEISGLVEKQDGQWRIRRAG